MKNIICIYAQRADNNQRWEEATGPESDYTGNTIAVAESPTGSITYDFSGCGEVDTPCLSAFFRKIGVQMGKPGYPVVKTVFDLMAGSPNLN